jgi:hypothetical protein
MVNFQMLRLRTDLGKGRQGRARVDHRQIASRADSRHITPLRCLGQPWTDIEFFELAGSDRARRAWSDSDESDVLLIHQR